MRTKSLAHAFLAAGLSLTAVSGEATTLHDGRGLAIVGAPQASTSRLEAKTIVPATDFTTFRDNVDLIGDFDGDGKDDFVVQDSVSLRILTTGTSTPIRTLSSVRAGAAMGHWNYAGRHSLGRVGDFDGDGQDDFVIYSGWGIGIIQRGADGRLVDLAMAPWGTDIGGWTLSPGDFVEQVGRFDPIYNGTRDQLVIRDRERRHLAIVVVDPPSGAFRARAVVREGTRIRQRSNSPIREVRTWRLRFGDELVGVIRMDAASYTLSGGTVSFVARDGLLIQRGNGDELGVLYTSRGRVHPATISRDGEGYSRGAEIVGTGQFSRAGWSRHQVLLKTSTGLRVLSFRFAGAGDYEHPQLFMTFFPEDLVPYGAALGSWRLDRRDVIGPIGDFTERGRDEFVIRSRWGMGVIRWSEESTRHRIMHRNGSSLGRWVLKSADFIPEVVSDGSPLGGNAGDLDGDGRDDFLLQCGSPWRDCPTAVVAPLP